MCVTNNKIAEQIFEGFQVEHVVKSDVFEILNISLGKEANFSEHTSPTNAQLIMLESSMQFKSKEESYQLSTQQLFGLPKNITHSVSANENSKILIIR